MHPTVEKLTAGDIEKFNGLLRVFEVEFEMVNFKMPSDNYLSSLLRKDDFFVFVALENGNVVGGLTSCLFDQYYSSSSLVYIYDLAVKRGFQRKGIGKLLIDVHNQFCRERNVEVVMVEADETDQHAIEFYRSTGGVGLNVVHFDYPLKEE